MSMLSGLPEVATQIGGYAAVPGASAALVTELAQAVEAAEPAVVGVDLVHRYPPEVLLPGNPGRGGLLAVLETVRDVLIFAPLALTWYRFSQAVSAYPADSKLSLLDFWRIGADGVEPLAKSAVAIAGLVAMVIVLTLVLHTARAREDRAAHRLAQHRAGLGTALASATLLLSRQASTGPVVTWESLREVADQLSRGTSAFADQLSRSTSAFAELVTSLGAEVREALQATDERFGQALSEWTAAAHGLTAMGARIAATEAVLAELTRLQQSVAAGDEQLRANIDRLVAQLEHASQVAAAEDESRRQVAERLVQANERLGATLPHLGGWTRVLEETLNRLRTLDGRWAAPAEPVPAPRADGGGGTRW